MLSIKRYIEGVSRKRDFCLKSWLHSIHTCERGYFTYYTEYWIKLQAQSFNIYDFTFLSLYLFLSPHFDYTFGKTKLVLKAQFWYILGTYYRPDFWTFYANFIIYNYKKKIRKSCPKDHLVQSNLCSSLACDPIFYPIFDPIFEKWRPKRRS